MAQTFLQRVQILGVMLRRDFAVMGTTVRASLIDCTIQASVMVFLQGYLFPYMGMPSVYIGALCIGSIVLFLLMQNSNMSFRMQTDILYGGFTRYQLTLPLPKSWFLARYVIRFGVQTACISLPTLIFSFIVLHDRIPNLAVRPGLFLIMYALVLVTISSLLIALGLMHDFSWLRANLWRRRLDPLLMLSTVFCSWQAVYAFSPKIAMLLLCNPVTHAVESLRTSLLYFDKAPSLWLSAGVLIMTIGFNCYCMKIGLIRRLDPV
jgi:hypothetical protein